jgi:8-amino-7-oxononanoate synthase
VPDFTSALYLGIGHPSHRLPPWDVLTTGRPAALGEVAGAQRLGRRLARLAAVPAALVYSSTLHLFLDVVDVLAREPVELYWDARLYPVMLWAIERAIGRGARGRSFDQHRAGELSRALAARGRGRAPIVFTTGTCPGCGQLAPLDRLLAEVGAAGGLLVVDDTQMLGLLGARDGVAPLGRGGGGSARFLGLDSERLLIGASLAKAFGAPLAFLAGASRLIETVARRGPTRWHSSPASAAAIAAAEHALDVNDRRGDQLRARVAALSTRVRDGLDALGLGTSEAASDPPHPIQSTRPLPRALAEALYTEVRARGLGCLLRHTSCSGGAVLSLLITAAHTETDVVKALALLRQAWAAVTSRRPTRTRQQGDSDHEHQLR